MFDKLKDMYELRKQAQEIQKRLGDEKVTGFSRDKSLEITLNGNQDITAIRLIDRESFINSDIEQTIKEAYDDAQRQLKNILMHQFKDMLQ